METAKLISEISFPANDIACKRLHLGNSTPAMKRVLHQISASKYKSMICYELVAVVLNISIIWFE